MPTATQMQDRELGRYTKVSVTGDGVFITDHYWVDTSSPVLAVTADGLPAYGSVHPDAPQSVVTVIDPDYQATAKAVFVRVEYTPVTLDFGGANLQDGDSFMRVNPIAVTAALREDLDGKPMEESGIQVQFSALELAIESYRSTILPIIVWLGIKDTINSNQVELAPIRGLAGNLLNAQPGELLMNIPPTVEPVRENLIRFTWRMRFGEAGTFDPIVRTVLDDGALGDPQMRRVYDPTVWPMPGVLW